MLCVAFRLNNNFHLFSNPVKRFNRHSIQRSDYTVVVTAQYRESIAAEEKDAVRRKTGKTYFIGALNSSRTDVTALINVIEEKQHLKANHWANVAIKFTS